MNQQTKPTPSVYDLDLQNRINTGLLELSATLLQGAEGQMRRKDLIFFALCDKCFATGTAIRCLCDQRLVDDAFALLRVLIEAMISAAYILESENQVAEDYADYPMFHAWYQFEQIRDVAPELAAYVSGEEQARMKADYEKVRARYEANRTKEWTKDNIFARAQFLDERSQHHLFRTLINVDWKTASAYVHSTATSLRSRIREDEKHVTISRLPTSEEISTVIHASNMTLFALLQILGLRLGKKGVDRWQELYREWKVTEAAEAAK